jgi:hypothetical protein
MVSTLSSSRVCWVLTASLTYTVDLCFFMQSWFNQYPRPITSNDLLYNLA